MFVHEYASCPILAPSLVESQAEQEPPAGCSMELHLALVYSKVVGDVAGMRRSAFTLRYRCSVVGKIRAIGRHAGSPLIYRVTTLIAEIGTSH